MLAAREQQTEFWCELMKSTPDLARLDAVGSSIEGFVSEASAGFAKLLKLNNNNVSVLRRFSQFLLEVWHVLFREPYDVA